MQAKRIVGAGLLVFAAFSIGFMLARPPEKSNPTPESAAAGEGADDIRLEPETVGEAPAAAKERQIIVYYFHGTRRCVTCKKLEAYSHEAVSSGFAEALADGTVQWRAVNVDEPANNHFIEDYQLDTKTVVLTKLEQGQQKGWKKLDKVWQLVGQKAVFVDYVQRELGEFMGRE